MSASLSRDTDATPTRVRARPSTKRLAVAALAVAAIAGAAWGGLGWWTTGRFIETTDDAYVGGDVTTISPHIAGFVTAILVADNEHVAAGQLLARIDARDFQADADRAQAVVQARAASLAILQAQRVLQQSVIQQSRADAVAKDARAAFTQLDQARYASLALTYAGSRQEAQRSQVADQEAQASVAASQAGLAASRQQMNVLDAQVLEAQATMAQAAADLRRASLNLGYTEIRSPIDGYVGNRAARVGAFVPEGSYLLSIVPATGLWVDANFKEDQLARMIPGQAASLTADAAPGETLHGRVSSIAPGTGAVFSVIPPENATGNFTKIVQRVPVRIMLDDASLGRLRPGLSTIVRIETKPAS